MAQIVYTLRGVKAYEWAKDHPDDPLYIEPVGAPDDGSSARGVKVDPAAPEVEEVLKDAPGRLACNVMD